MTYLNKRPPAAGAGAAAWPLRASIRPRMTRGTRSRSAWACFLDTTERRPGVSQREGQRRVPDHRRIRTQGWFAPAASPSTTGTDCWGRSGHHPLPMPFFCACCRQCQPYPCISDPLRSLTDGTARDGDLHAGMLAPGSNVRNGWLADFQLAKVSRNGRGASVSQVATARLRSIACNLRDNRATTHAAQRYPRAYASRLLRIVRSEFGGSLLRPRCR